MGKGSLFSVNQPRPKYLKSSIKVMSLLSEEATLLFVASLLSRDQLLKDRICPYRGKVFPLKVDPPPKSYLVL